MKARARPPGNSPRIFRKPDNFPDSQPIYRYQLFGKDLRLTRWISLWAKRSLPYWLACLHSFINAILMPTHGLQAKRFTVGSFISASSSSPMLMVPINQDLWHANNRFIHCFKEKLFSAKQAFWGTKKVSDFCTFVKNLTLSNKLTLASPTNYCRSF